MSILIRKAGFDRVFNDAWLIFSKTFAWGALFYLLYTLLVVAVFALPIFAVNTLGLFPDVSLSGNNMLKHLSQFDSLEGLKLLLNGGVFVICAVFYVILAALFLTPYPFGIFKLCQRADRGEPIQFSDFFHGYQNFTKVTVYQILIQFLTYVLLGAMFSVSFLNMKSSGVTFSGVMLSAIFKIVLSWSLSAFFVMGGVLVSLGRQGAIDALVYSVRGTLKNYFVVVGAFAIAGIISSVGLLGLGIGVFFTVSFASCVSYVLYKQILAPECTAQDDSILVIEE